MMPLSEIFFLAIVLYLLYRFVFNFLLPVVRTTRQVREQFRNMQEGMGAGEWQQFSTGQQGQGQQRADGQKQSRPSGSKPPASDYIDFEEIK